MNPNTFEIGDVLKIIGSTEYLIVRDIKKKHLFFGEKLYVFENTKTHRFTKPMNKEVIDEFLCIVYDPREIRRAKCFAIDKASAKIQAKLNLDLQVLKNMKDYDL